MSHLGNCLELDYMSLARSAPVRASFTRSNHSLIAMTTEADIYDGLKELTQLADEYRLRRRLILAEPEELVARDTQIQALLNHLTECVKPCCDFTSKHELTDARGAVYIYGPPGTGKTATIRNVLQRLQSKGKNHARDCGSTRCTRSSDELLLLSSNPVCGIQKSEKILEINATGVRSNQSGSAAYIEILCRILETRTRDRRVGAVLKALSNQGGGKTSVRDAFFSLWLDNSAKLPFSEQEFPQAGPIPELLTSSNAKAERSKRRTSTGSRRPNVSSVKITSRSNLANRRKSLEGSESQASPQNDPGSNQKQNVGTDIVTRPQRGGKKRNLEVLPKIPTSAQMKNDAEQPSKCCKKQPKPESLQSANRSMTRKRNPLVVFIDEMDTLGDFNSGDIDPMLELYKVALTPFSNIILIGCSNLTQAPSYLQRNLRAYTSSCSAVTNPCVSSPQKLNVIDPFQSQDKQQSKVGQEKNRNHISKDDSTNTAATDEAPANRNKTCANDLFKAILFPAYTKNEIRLIVEEKLSGVSDRIDATGRWTGTAIKVLASHIEKTTGDCRLTIDVLSRAIDTRLAEIANEIKLLKTSLSHCVTSPKKIPGKASIYHARDERKPDNNQAELTKLQTLNGRLPVPGTKANPLVRSNPPPPLCAKEIEALPLPSTQRFFWRTDPGSPGGRPRDAMGLESECSKVQISTTPSTIAPSTPPAIFDAEEFCGNEMRLGAESCGSPILTWVQAKPQNKRANSQKVCATYFREPTSMPISQVEHMHGSQLNDITGVFRQSNRSVNTSQGDEVAGVSPILTAIQRRFGNIDVDFTMKHIISQKYGCSVDGLSAKIDSILHIDRLCLYAIWAAAKRSHDVERILGSSSRSKSQHENSQFPINPLTQVTSDGMPDHHRRSSGGFIKRTMSSSELPSFDGESLYTGQRISAYTDVCRWTSNCVNTWNVRESSLLSPRRFHSSCHDASKSSNPHSRHTHSDSENVSPNCIVNRSATANKAKASGSNERGVRHAADDRTQNHASSAISSHSDHSTGFAVSLDSVEAELKKIIQAIDPKHTLLPASHSSFLGSALESLADIGLISRAAEPSQCIRTSKIQGQKNNRSRTEVMLQLPLAIFHQSEHLNSLWSSIEERYYVGI